MQKNKIKQKITEWGRGNKRSHTKTCGKASRTGTPIPGEAGMVKNLYHIFPRWKSAQQGAPEKPQEGQCSPQFSQVTNRGGVSGGNHTTH